MRTVRVNRAAFTGGSSASASLLDQAHAKPNERTC